MASEEQPACPLEINADASSVSQARLEELARQGVIDWSPGGVPLCKGTMKEAVDYGQLLVAKLLQGIDPNLVTIPIFGSYDPENMIDTQGYAIGGQPPCPEGLVGDNGLSQTQLRSLHVRESGEYRVLYRTGDFRPICLLADGQMEKVEQAISEAQE